MPEEARGRPRFEKVAMTWRRRGTVLLGADSILRIAFSLGGSELGLQEIKLFVEELRRELGKLLVKHLRGLFLNDNGVLLLDSLW